MHVQKIGEDGDSQIMLPKVNIFKKWWGTMKQTESLSIHDALQLILDKRDSDIQTVTDFAGAYNLKRRFALKAREEIFSNYAEVIRANHVQKNPFIDSGIFDFTEPNIQLAYWIDSLLHNCRGSLETLAQIVNYVYELNLSKNFGEKGKSKLVSFYNVIKASEGKTGVAGIHSILWDIQNDAWFTIINKLRNRSYHVVLNGFIPKIRFGSPLLQYNIRFPIDPSEGNLNHETLDLFLEAGYKFEMASMDLAELTNFIAIRLDEYLSQVDAVIIDDCKVISENKPPKSDSNIPRLKISYMKLHSWRNLIDADEFLGNSSKSKI